MPVTGHHEQVRSKVANKTNLCCALALNGSQEKNGNHEDARMSFLPSAPQRGHNRAVPTSERLP